MSYTPQAPPAVPPELKAIIDWMERELKYIAANFQEQDQVKLTVNATTPDRPRQGTIIYADSVNWNPGSGEGVYAYVSSAGAFVKL